MSPTVRTTALVAGLAAALLGAGCSGDEPPAPRAGATSSASEEPTGSLPDLDLPPGSSGSLVAALDGEMTACEGWGLADRETGVGAGCDTVYDVMSMTKQFTGAAIVALVEDGLLEVDDPIGDHLGGVPADKRRITVEHLLTHTSGLRASLGGDYEPLSKEGLVTAAMDSRLLSAPGVRHRYSNVGYSLLAAIVEEVSGVGYEDYLAERLFERAGMTRTGYVLPDWGSADVAIEYDDRGHAQGTPMDHPWADDGPYWNLFGNGGMLSTARDMFLWHRALEGDEVLDDASKAQLFRPRVAEVPGGDSSYAYGWVVLDTGLGRALWHNGGNGWSYGELARIPEGEAMVFWVTNQSRSRAPRWNLERSGSAITEQVLVELLAED